MTNIRRFHPGVYIKESLDAMEMTAKEFSARTGISERTLSSIISEKGDITFDVAYKLASYFDNSILYWTNLQTQYNVYLLEKDKEKEIEEEWNLIKPIKKYLIDEHFILPDDDKKDVVIKCRTLVGVNSLLLLNKKDAFVCFKEQNNDSVSNCFYQNFWLALALKAAREKEVNPFNKKLLNSSLNEIRKMTIQKPDVFIPRLQELLEKCGISFVLLPYLNKSNIYGATKWFSKENVMLAVSNRGGQADLFWFTLFHEISHVLMEHRRETLINMENSIDEEANKMAEDILIPRNQWNSFINRKMFTKEAIEYFADNLGIHPCIVLGRLHKENIIPYEKYTKVFSLHYNI